MNDTYLSAKSLAQKYDLHIDTMRKRLKELDIKKDEHYIIIGDSVRYHAIKIHNLLISAEDNKTAQEVLNRLIA
ncbi:MAG: hypothetical protein WA080_02695 [Sulfuricurvum sp.]